MIHLLLIACAVGMALSAAVPSFAPEWATLPVAGGVFLGGVALTVLVVHVYVLRCARRMDRRGDGGAVWRAERAIAIGRVLLVAMFFAVLIGLGWLRLVRDAVGDLPAVDELLALSPVLVGFLAFWASGYEIERRIRDAGVLRDLEEGRVPARPGRARHVVRQARHHMLFIVIPVALLLAWSELVIWAQGKVSYGSGWFDAGWYGALPAWLSKPQAVQVLSMVLQVAGVGAIFCLMPLVIRRVWDTVRLDAGVLRDLIEGVCRAHRVRVRDLLVWRTDHSMANAAVIGLLPRLRYVLLSDSLLEHLTDEQLEAVAAHEVGHVRRRHMPWLAVMLFSAMVAVGVPAALLTRAGGLSDDGWIAAVVQGLAALGGAVLYFGWVSRRFEWQADAFAAGHLSAGTVTPEAAEAMSGALRRVARLNGVPIGKKTWRHGSIATRLARLDALVGTPVSRLPIDRQVGWIKLASVFALVAGLFAAWWVS